MIDFAQHAEELGFHSGWVSDHVAWPQSIASKYPYSDDGSFAPAPDMPWLDPIGTMFFVAGCTERMLLGSTVLILGYRPPVLTAKAIASLDVVSGGRAILGVGVGWMREEFEILGMPFDHRGRRADEQLELFATLFRDDVPSYHGAYYDVPEIGFAPKPVHGRVPIWVGGDTEPAFRRVARFGDAWHAAFQPLDEVAAGWRRVGELCAEAGREPSAVRLSVRLYLDPDGSMPAAKSIAGSPAEMVDTIGRWAAVGVDHVLLDPVAPGGLDGRRTAMERFMTDVAPATG
jgi:probable F420-dependent oxidoreductase